MPALDLNSPEWGRLEDAYGTAGQIPQLLIALASGDDAALDELFGCICHQMSVYSSSIAAFPHLIAIASRLEANPKLQVDTLCLAGAICESRGFDSELESSEFADAARAALPDAIGLARAALRKTTDRHAGVYLINSVAAFDHMQALARVVEGFSDEEFSLECPSCSVDLYIWPCPEGLSVAAEDPVNHKQTKRTFVSRGMSDQSGREEDLRWLEAESAGIPILADLHSKLPFLFGDARCPKCGHTFPLFDELAEQAS